MSLQQIWHRLILLGWAMASAPTLFRALHRLPWYGGLLREWAAASLAPVRSAPRLHVVEVGSGPGLLAQDIAHLGAIVTGVDRSQRMVRLASKGMEDDRRLLFVQGALPELPLSDHSTDAALAASVLNVVDDPQAAVADLVRIVRPGGVVAVLFPSAFENAAHWPLAQWADQQNITGFSRSVLFHWLSIARTLSPVEVRQWFTAAGLHDVTVTPYIAGRVVSVQGRVPAI